MVKALDAEKTDSLTSHVESWLSTMKTGCLLKRSLKCNNSAVVLVFCLVLFSLQTVSGLLCYVCRGEPDNSFCSQPEHLVNCTAESHLYDTCQTKVEHEGGEKYIYKRCVQGPCSLETSQDRALALGTDCKRGRDDTWSCESCCKTDRCNAGLASGLTVPYFTIVFMVAYALGHNAT